MNFVYHCPRCLSHETVRCHRTKVDRWILGLRPFYCSLCEHRFYAPREFGPFRVHYKVISALRALNPLERVSFRRLKQQGPAPQRLQKDKRQSSFATPPVSSHTSLPLN